MPQPKRPRHSLTSVPRPHRFARGSGRGSWSIGLSLKSPKPVLRKLTFAAGIVCALLAYVLPGASPAWAQGIGILRDTETEEMLKS